MEYSNQEVKVSAEFDKKYTWKVNGEELLDLTGNLLSLNDSQFDELDDGNQTVEVEVTVYSQCGASDTKILVIQRVPIKGKSELITHTFSH